LLKVRIIPTLLHKDFGLVKGVGFNSWRRTGSVMQAVKVYNLREVDELIFLDVAATPAGRSPDFNLIDDIADECFMPLTVGGGVSSLADFERLLAVGADKVAVNTAAIADPSLIEKAAARFGSQCVVVSIDFRRSPSGGLAVHDRCGTRSTGLQVLDWARTVERLGAGEILLTSIERDGTMQGYDEEAIREVAASLSIPVIASGGAGSYAHMRTAIEAGAAAVAAASIYHFTELTPLATKAYLKQAGIPVRLLWGS
jgi:cyclase